MLGQPPKIALTFLDDRAHDFYPDWDVFADVTVAIPLPKPAATR